MAQVESELGKLDILVCSAGVGGDSVRAVDMPDEEWRRVFAINCDGTFFCNRAAVRKMVERGYGRVVNVASIAGKEGNPECLRVLGEQGRGNRDDEVDRARRSPVPACS